MLFLDNNHDFERLLMKAVAMRETKTQTGAENVALFMV